MCVLRPFALTTGAFILGAVAAVAQQDAPVSPGDAASANVSASAGWERDPDKVHDPSTIIIAGGVRRVFCTGPGVVLMREDRAGKWVREGRVFAAGHFPPWQDEVVPGNRGYLWAPDVMEIGGRFFLYYSVSTFGKNRSAIGLAIGRSIDPSSLEWSWEDRGVVVASRTEDRFNAIDPAIFRDRVNGSLWMTFGSFWDGIHLIELDRVSGMRREPAELPVRLAFAPEIEAPFLHQRGSDYYLFVNWGKCCRGVNSTYEIRVGRSRAVTGPYLDREGREMAQGGGTLLLSSEDRWVGPGHASIHVRDGSEWLVHHYYDRELRGRSRLRMVRLTWDVEGWPLVDPDGSASAATRNSAPDDGL